MDKKGTVAIVEDEELIREELQSMLESFGYEVICACGAGEELFLNIQSKIPDLVLLDIAISGEMNGIEIAHILNSKYQLPFVFISSRSEEEMLDRVKHTQSNGFIAKPFTENQLRANLSLIFHNLEHKTSDRPPSDSIYVKQDGKLIKVMLNDIYYLKAMDNYTIINTVDQKLIYSYPLKTVFKKLSDKSGSFQRVHRSYAVNVKHVNEVLGNVLKLSTGKEIPLSDSQRPGLLQQIDLL